MFGFIGVGGTLGSITGSATAAALATRIGAITLLLVSAALLELAVFTVMRFPLRGGGATPMSGRKRPDGHRRDVIGGSVWAGFTHVLKSPYLLGDLRLHAAVHDRRDVPLLRADAIWWGASTRTARRGPRCWRSSSWPCRR